MTTTQSCAECGTRAEPGQSFCDACGAVLSWTDRAGARAGAGAAAERGEGNRVPGQRSSAEDDPAARLDALSLRLDAMAAGSYDSVGAGSLPEPENGDASHPATRLDADPAVAAAPPQTPYPHPSSALAPHLPHDGDGTVPTQPVPATPPESEAERARRLLVPVDDPEPRQAPSVAPVLPGRPVAARPQSVRAPGVEPGAVGGVPCPWCATANRPDRHYCTRCAMPMAGEEQVAGRLPWWRRMLTFRSGEIPWAGDRPRLRRTFDRVLTWIGAAIVLTLLIVLAVNIPRGVQAAKDHFAKRAPVSPDRVTASRSFPGHKPELAFDKLNNTWWGPGVSQSGEGQWLEAKFDEPTRLLDVLITPGVSTRADQLGQSALPHRIEARITTADGKTTTRELSLDQGAGAQRRAFRVGEVTSVRFTIESAYGASGKKQVAIAEIEFFGPSNSGGS
ncbi:NADase-type glycan-binding domain-containing protein [Streptomyces sp. NPDC050548]|uniref:NADase-type glycan-binding domain-containing protein n=1 Tax=Streptomyces sp. NPDC050548 TaxID=3365629 RepID=UPI00378B561F